jgi:hypothetical protein
MLRTTNHSIENSTRQQPSNASAKKKPRLAVRLAGELDRLRYLVLPQLQPLNVRILKIAAANALV